MKDYELEEIQEQIDAIDSEVTDISDKCAGIVDDMADLYLILMDDPNIAQQTKDAIKKRFYSID
jgi:hypothetical protein